MLDINGECGSDECCATCRWGRLVTDDDEGEGVFCNLNGGNEIECATDDCCLLYKN